MDRHPSRAPGARIDTLPVRSILWIEHLPDARIEHLSGRAECGSNTCPPLHARADRTAPRRLRRRRRSPAPRPRGSNTCPVSGRADRTDPVRSIPWIETLRSRRTRRSTPFRPDPRHGSTPFAGAGRADRHPSGPLDPADRTLAGRADRTLTRRGGVRIEHLPPAPDPRGSNTCPVSGGADRTDPVCSIPRIETLRSRRTRGSTPFRPDPRHGSTPLAVAGAQIDTLPRRRIDTLRGHRMAPIDTLFVGSIP